VTPCCFPPLGRFGSVSSPAYTYLVLERVRIFLYLFLIVFQTSWEVFEIVVPLIPAISVSFLVNFIAPQQELSNAVMNPSSFFGFLFFEVRAEASVIY